jgi:dihydrodipicolinate reductase
MPDNRTRVAIAGAGGRMGRMLVTLLAEHPGLVLSAALEHPSSPHLGTDAGPCWPVSRQVASRSRPTRRRRWRPPTC